MIEIIQWAFKHMNVLRHLLSTKKTKFTFSIEIDSCSNIQTNLLLLYEIKLTTSNNVKLELVKENFNMLGSLV